MIGKDGYDEIVYMVIEFVILCLEYCEKFFFRGGVFIFGVVGGDSYIEVFYFIGFNFEVLFNDVKVDFLCFVNVIVVFFVV